MSRPRLLDRTSTPDLSVLLDRAEAVPTKLDAIADDLAVTAREFAALIPETKVVDYTPDVRAAATLLRALLKVARTAAAVRSDRNDEFWRKVAAEFDLLGADIEVMCAALSDLRAIMAEKVA